MLKRIGRSRWTRGEDCVPVLFDIFRSVRVSVPASSREEEDVLVLQVANALRPGLDDRPVAICQEWVLEGDARVEMLADEEVAVV